MISDHTITIDQLSQAYSQLLQGCAQLTKKNNQQAETIAQQDEELVQKNDLIEELVNVQAYLQEQHQICKNEIAILKGYSPQPSIRPSTLEGPGAIKKAKEEKKKLKNIAEQNN